MSSNYKSISISELIEDYCPINLTKEDYNRATLQEVDDDYRSKTLFFDPSYQRMYGSWDNDRKRKYIKSIFMKWIYTPIVFSALSREAKETKPDNLKYACLDGQHRTNAIAEFISNKFGLCDTIEIDGKEKHFNNVLFKDLTPRERALFLRRTVEIQIINPYDEEMKKSKQTLSQIFLAINDGAPLNSQEKRNAVQCDMSEWSRECYDMYKGFLAKKIYNKRNINRMAMHEYVSKIYLFLKNYIISDTTGTERVFVHLDETNLNEIFNSSYRINNKISSFISKNLMTVFNGAAIVEHNKHHLKRLQKTHLWVLTMIYSMLVLEEGKSFKDISEDFTIESLWDFTIETYDSLQSSSKLLWASMYEKLEKEEITEEQFSKLKFFHVEFPRFHVSSSAKLCYMKLYEHLNNNVSSAIKSWYARKNTSVLKTA